MAATKPIKAKYSPKLDSMAAFINGFLLNKKLPPKIVTRTHQGISDFCYKNTSTFKREFLLRAGVSQLRRLPPATNVKNEVDKFVVRLTKLQGECVFLLKDTFNILTAYQQKLNKGFGISVNRSFLCRGEEDYFLLIKLVYDTLNKSKNIEDFQKKYFSEFRMLIEKDAHFRDRAEKISEYVSTYTKSRHIIFVDLGFQFTFSLFCTASIQYFVRNALSADFYSFSAYPWLQQFFKTKCFSESSEAVLGLELEAIKDFKNGLSDRRAGTFVGFAIGDALGYPIAGIDKSDMPKFIKTEIKQFTSNPKHPFFSHLKKAQYTDNTNFLIVSAQHLIKNRGFVIAQYAKDLATWGKKILRIPCNERWAGPTGMRAIKNLIDGKSYRKSGSTSTDSCSATYRIIPIGIFYRPLSKEGLKKLKNTSEISAMVTHNSEISKTGAVITALIIANLLYGVLPEQAILGALKQIIRTNGNKVLIAAIQRAVSYSKTKNADFARKAFGTGSPIQQTLPLALFYFLKFQNDFEKAVLTAANSYRNDTPSEKKRLQKFSWQEQLQLAKGGNADGIAALTGAFMGAHLGYKRIPRKFGSIENKSKLIALAGKVGLVS